MSIVLKELSTAELFSNLLQILFPPNRTVSNFFSALVTSLLAMKLIEENDTLVKVFGMVRCSWPGQIKCFRWKHADTETL